MRTGALVKNGVLLWHRTLVLCSAFLLVVSLSTLAQAQENRSYALERAKVEVAVGVGTHQIETEGVDENGIKTQYTPGGDAAFTAGVGVGITPHFSGQFGFSLTRYENDMYWRPETPHNPYLATADLLNFLAGIRWDIRNPRGRVRPYLGGGVVAAHFAGVNRGPSELCFASGACLQMAPELFAGTKVTGYFDMGLNFYTKGRWGFGGGLRVFNMKGAGQAPAVPVTTPTGNADFWHNEFYGSLLLRLR